MAVELTLDNIKWPKDFLELKAIDDLLHCGICYGYMKTCMITSCSHNYCSLCIRKSMQYKTQCPTCFEETYESSLRNNRVLDQFVELFSNIRDKLLRHLRIADLQLGSTQQNDDHIPRCIKLEQGSPLSLIDNAKKVKGESSKISTTLDLLKTQTNKASISRRLDDELFSPPIRDESLHKIPKMFLSPKKQLDMAKPKQNTDVPTVPCPVCHVDIPERNINIHLDSCLERSEKPVLKSPEKKNKRSPIAKRVYSMMSEKDLRKLSKDYGLNNHGDKKALITRLQRFTVLFNSECDSENPRPVTDLIRQIEKEENGEKKNSNTLLVQPRLPAINRKTDPKIIEEENKKYLQDNKDSFNALINSMRTREGMAAPHLKKEKNNAGLNLKKSVPVLTESESEEEVNKEELIAKCNQQTDAKSKDKDYELFDSSEDELSEEYPASPVLRSTTTPARNNKLSEKNLFSKNDNSAIDLPQNSTLKVNKVNTPRIKLVCKELGDSKTVNGICETQILSSDSDTSVPSPSCILPESEEYIFLHSESEPEDNSNHVESDHELTELFEETKLKDSQIDDPDFNIEDEEESEEIFVTRRSKRKQSTPSPSCATPASHSKKIKTPVSTENPVSRTLRKRVKR